jgi:hypothetical protein
VSGQDAPLMLKRPKIPRAAADIIRLNLTGLTLSPFSGVSKESNSSPGSGRCSQLARLCSPRWQGETIRLRNRPNTARESRNTQKWRDERLRTTHGTPYRLSPQPPHLIFARDKQASGQRATGLHLQTPRHMIYGNSPRPRDVERRGRMEEERCSNGSSNRLQLQHWHGTHDQLYLHNTTNPQDSEAHGQDASSSLSLLMRPNIIRTPQLNLTGLTLSLFQESDARKAAKSSGSSGRGSQLLHPRSRPQWQGPTARESRHTPRWNDPIEVDGSLIQKARYPLKQGLDSMCHWRRLGCTNVTIDSKSAAQMKRDTRMGILINLSVSHPPHFFLAPYCPPHFRNPFKTLSHDTKCCLLRISKYQTGYLETSRGPLPNMRPWAQVPYEGGR